MGGWSEDGGWTSKLRIQKILISDHKRTGVSGQYPTPVFCYQPITPPELRVRKIGFRGGGSEFKSYVGGAWGCWPYLANILLWSIGQWQFYLIFNKIRQLKIRIYLRLTDLVGCWPGLINKELAMTKTKPRSLQLITQSEYERILWT